MSGLICKMVDQKGDLKGHLFFPVIEEKLFPALTSMTIRLKR